MTVDLSKLDIIRLLKGTSVPYEFWDEMPEDLGSVQGGGWTDPTWHWTINLSKYANYTEEELYLLYTRIKKVLEG